MHNRVVINIGDNHLWNQEYAVTQIVYCLMKFGSVVIDLDKEGPDIKCTELKTVLDCLSDHGIAFDQIEVHTGNVLETYDRFRVVKHAKWMYELRDFQKKADNINKTKKIQKHFGCFIGRSNINRLITAGYLYANHNDKSLLSFHFQPGHDYHRVHLGLEDIIYHFGTKSSEYKNALALLDVSPIKLSEESVYPIVNSKAIEIAEFYKNIFVDVVCETFSNGDVFFVTEKFWRAVATKTPFILQGAQFTLQRLRQLGFKTFDRWWDEGYDEDPYLYSHNEMHKSIASIASLSVSDLNAMYHDMKPILDHNYSRMMELTYQDFDNVK